MTIIAIPDTVAESDRSREDSQSWSWPPALAMAGRVVGAGCQWGLEVIAGHLILSSLAILAAWPFLPATWHWGLPAVFGVVFAVAVVAGRRQSLLRLASVMQYRFRVRRTIRKWPETVKVKAALSKTVSAVDIMDRPLKSAGHKLFPTLIYGRYRKSSWYMVGWRPRYFGPVATPYGIRMTINGAPTGAVLPTLMGEQQVIRGSLNAYGMSMRVNPYLEYLTDISILYRDPFKAIIYPSQLPPAQEDLGVVLGIDCDADPLEHSLWLPTLIVGRKGSGKSRLVRRILQGLCEAGQPFLILCFDPKGYSRDLDQGQEFPWLKSSAWHYEANPDRWPEFVAYLCTMMLQQASRLGALGLSECPTGDERFPLIVAIVDELGTALDETSATRRIQVNGSGSTVEKALRRYLRENRSGGATMIANTQVAQKNDLSIGKKSIKDLFDFVICMGVNNAETTRMALGISDAKQAPAHEIPVGRKYSGIAYASSSERGIRKFRAAFTSDDASESVARDIRYWTTYYENYYRMWRHEEARHDMRYTDVLGRDCLCDPLER